MLKGVKEADEDLQKHKTLSNQKLRTWVKSQMKIYKKREKSRNMKNPEIAKMWEAFMNKYQHLFQK